MHLTASATFVTRSLDADESECVTWCPMIFRFNMLMEFGDINWHKSCWRQFVYMSWLLMILPGVCPAPTRLFSFFPSPHCPSSHIPHPIRSPGFFSMICPVSFNSTEWVAAMRRLRKTGWHEVIGSSSFHQRGELNLSQSPALHLSAP